jgi:hypothetical protein
MQVSKLGTVQPEISLHSTRDQHRKHHPCCYEQTLRTIHADIINRGRSRDRRIETVAARAFYPNIRQWAQGGFYPVLNANLGEENLTPQEPWV